MDLDIRKRELVHEFLSSLRKTSSLSTIWIGVLIAIILVGLTAFVLQFLKGHEITGMRDNVVWGIYIVNFIFCCPLQYRLALSAILRFLTHSPATSEKQKIGTQYGYMYLDKYFYPLSKVQSFSAARLDHDE